LNLGHIVCEDFVVEDAERVVVTFRARVRWWHPGAWWMALRALWRLL
jgi:hypothetical protein